MDSFKLAKLLCQVDNWELVSRSWGEEIYHKTEPFKFYSAASCTTLRSKEVFSKILFEPNFLLYGLVIAPLAIRLKNKLRAQTSENLKNDKP